MAQIELQPLPHREAIEYFRSKGYAPQLQRFHHLDHYRQEHARNFVVAKAMRDDALATIRNHLQEALEDGRTLQQFQAELKPELQKAGWWGKSIERDPATGELQEVQLGSMRRLRTIFDTNMRTAHAAGHWARIQRTKRALPYLEYVQIERPSKRHDHARFHGLIRPVDDPVWQRIYPPNGWFCGCTVLQRTAGQLARAGKEVSPPFDLDEVPWTNKRTGEVTALPRGVHPGFDTNPGATWLDLGEDWAAMTPDLTPERRAKELGLIEGLRLDRLRDAHESLIVLDGASDPVSMYRAMPDQPGIVHFDTEALPALPSFLHSHVTETPLSIQDIESLQNHKAEAITAISPGGSIWRAVRGNEPLRRPLLEFRANAAADMSAFAALPPEEGVTVYQHSLLLWLERRGVLTYSYRTSERVRQLIERHADLIGRLTNARDAL